MVWINVNDKIPELRKYVLCKIAPEAYSRSPEKEFIVAYCYDRNEGARELCKELRAKGSRPTLFCNPECDCGPFLLGWTTLEEVTHWMELPDKPK